MEAYRAILIAGPTASGKSALAARLAARHNGVVVNADSMQVYRDLRILTARPREEEEQRVPHALYGHVSGAVPYSVGSWLRDVQAVLEDCRRVGLLPIVTGGTGLYFKALVEGLAPIPLIPQPIRDHWRAEAIRLGAAGLHSLLSRSDPDTAAMLKVSDTQRLTRAMEVWEATGKGLAAWQQQPGVPLVPVHEALRLVVTVDREALHARADARFDQMMAEGAWDEVRGLAALGYSAELPVMRALGVAPLIAALLGQLEFGAAVSLSKRDTRQYIKRQETWLRRNMMSWNAISTQDMESISEKNFTFTPF